MIISVPHEYASDPCRFTFCQVMTSYLGPTFGIHESEELGFRSSGTRRATVAKIRRYSYTCPREHLFGNAPNLFIRSRSRSNEHDIQGKLPTVLCNQTDWHMSLLHTDTYRQVCSRPVIARYRASRPVQERMWLRREIHPTMGVDECEWRMSCVPLHSVR